MVLTITVHLERYINLYLDSVPCQLGIIVHVGHQMTIAS